jgi:hypothetical protein
LKRTPWPAASPSPRDMAQRTLLNGTELIWRLPSVESTAGVILLAHGCRQAPTVWFSKSVHCPECAPRPEERCITAAALQAGFAVVAASNVAGRKGCWVGEDVPAVRSALDHWRALQRLTAAPLVAFGPSSGGWFAAQVGRAWPDVRAVGMQVMVPVPEDVRQPLPSGRPSFPPLQMTLMQGDKGK